MENQKGLIKQASEATEQIKRKTKSTIKNYLTTIVLLVLIAFTVAISISTLTFKNRIDVDFWINLAYMILISIVSLGVMMPLGGDSEKKTLRGYYENRKIWAEKTSHIIEHGKATRFNDYCRDYTNRLRKEKRENFVLEASISLEDYYSIFEPMTIKELRAYYRKCKIERRAQEKWSGSINTLEIKTPLSYGQYRLIKRTKKRIKVKPIVPTRILNASNNKNSYSIGQAHAPFIAKVMSTRIICVIAYSIVLVSVAIVPTGETGVALFISIIFRVFGVVTSAIMGFNAGRQLTRNDNCDTLDRIVFLCTFNEQDSANQVKPATIEKITVQPTQEPTQQHALLVIDKTPEIAKTDIL